MGNTITTAGGNRVNGFTAAASNTPVASSTTPLSEVPEYNAPRAISKEMYDKGYRINTITVELSGNMHFQGWWDVVGTDVSVLCARGSAYQGQTVKIGRNWSDQPLEEFTNAAVVHMKKVSGYCHKAEVTVIGKPGETVELRYVRLAPPPAFRDLATKGEGTASSKVLEVTSGTKQYAQTREDRYWRITRVKIEDNPSLQSKLYPTPIEYFQDDMANGNKDTPGFAEPGENEMGGGANPEDAAAHNLQKCCGFINAR